jgi:hypothetical protein
MQTVKTFTMGQNRVSFINCFSYFPTFEQLVGTMKQTLYTEQQRIQTKISDINRQQEENYESTEHKRGGRAGWMA